MTEAARDPGDLRWETRLLAVVTAVLVVFGVANSYAAFIVQAGGSSGMKQVVGALAGLIGLTVMARVDYHLWRRLAWPILALTLLLLVVPILPFTHGIAPASNGARRWIDLGPFSFQPSEVARVALVIWAAALAAKKGEQVRQLKKGMLPFLLVLGLAAFLILLEPNLSMAALTFLVGVIVLFAAGAKIGHFILLGFGGLWLVWEQIEGATWRYARLLAFLDPAETAAGAGYQVQQSVIGFGAGRLLGVGFGEGQQKLGYVPYVYNDFLFSTIGEEWGFLGVLLVVGFFSLFCWLGFRIARTADDPFGRFLAAGITALVGVSALMHMGVSLSLLPTTGINLPFMSYGLSSLGITLLATGILVNIGRRRGRRARVPAGRR